LAVFTLPFEKHLFTSFAFFIYCVTFSFGVDFYEFFTYSV
jgi:hypothetical protein